MRMSTRVVDVAPPDDLTWGPAVARQLRSARESAAHTQAQLAAALVTDFDLENQPTQGTVSRWLSGDAVPRSEQRGSLIRYIDTYAPTQQDTSERWRDLVTIASDEPLLGPRQSDLIDALIQRLAAGPPLSIEDSRLAGALARRLGLRDLEL